MDWELLWRKGKKGARTGMAHVDNTSSTSTRYYCHISRKKGGPFVLSFAPRLEKDPIECNTRGEAKLLARTIFRLEGPK